MAGISNVDTEKFFENQDKDIKQNFVSVIRQTLSQNYSKIMKEKGSIYPFAIFYTDRSNKPGTQRWSFLNIEPKSQLLYLMVKDIKDLNILL